jgi:hypothetical protein
MNRIVGFLAVIYGVG